MEKGPDCKDEQSSSEAKQDKISGRMQKVRRGFWIITILSLVIGFLFHMSIQLRSFLTYKLLEVNGAKTMSFEFPDAIFCSPTYFSHDRVERYKWKGTVNYRDEIFTKNLRNVFFAIVEGTLNVSHFSNEHFEKNLQLSKLAFLPTLAVNEVGSTIPDVLTFCEFGQHSCDIRNFTTFLHHDYGICIRFHQQPDTLHKFGAEPRNGLIVHLRLDKLPKLVVGRTLPLTLFGFKSYLQRKATWPNTENILAYGLENDKTFLKMTQRHVTRLSTIFSPCRPDSKQRLCYLERVIGLTCKEFLLDDYALMQMYAQKSLVEKCKCISYEWALTEDQRQYPSCHYLPDHAYLNSGILEKNGTFLVVMANNFTIDLRILVDIAAVRKRIQCYQDAKLEFQNLRSKERFLKKEQRKWSVLCNENRYSVLQQKFLSTMAGGSDYKQADGMFLASWKVLMKALKESGSNQTAVMKEAVEKNEAILANSSSSSKSKSDALEFLRKMNVNSTTYLIYPDSEQLTPLEETLEYEKGQFFADIGGLSGVWTGLCVLSFLSLIEKAFISIRRRINNRSKAGSSMKMQPFEGSSQRMEAHENL